MTTPFLGGIIMWLFLSGLFVGGCVSLFTMAILNAASYTDSQMEDQFKHIKEDNNE